MNDLTNNSNVHCYQSSLEVFIKSILFTVNAFEQQLLITILALNWSFQTVEHSHFRNLVSLFYSETKMSDCTKIESLLKNHYEKVHKSALEELESQIKVSIVLDCWTSSNNLAFINITDYFINENWNYWEVLFGFKELEKAHTDENLISYVIEVLKLWKLKHKLLAVTADNIYNNQTLCKHLSKLLKQWRIDWDYQENTVNCMTHVI